MSDPLHELYLREIEPCIKLLRGYAFRLAKDPYAAEELMQEVRFRAFMSLHSYTPGTRPSAWLSTMMYHVFLNGIRRTRRVTLTDSWGDHEHHLHVEVCFAELHGYSDQVQKAIAKLEHHELEVLLLRVKDDLDYTSISRILQIPLGTVKSALFRIRAILKERLAEYARSQYNIN